MKIVLATGIYPPEIGGPATYVQRLAEGLLARGHDITVVTYGDPATFRTDPWRVLTVSRSGGPLMRWLRYASVLGSVARDADAVEAFSSVSAGVPLWLARLKKPKKVLRLGGDFFWERSTDRGSTKTLAQWMRWHPLRVSVMAKLLRTVHHIVFSTTLQRDLWRASKRAVPNSSVIENAVPESHTVLHAKHDPLRLLFLGRFVKFKNLPSLLQAITKYPAVTLTLAGSGPEEANLRKLVKDLLLEHRVWFVGDLHGEEKAKAFAEHDLLVLPSLTEISPHAALEARAAGLPVLLTLETGLSSALSAGMVRTDLSSPKLVLRAIADAASQYAQLAQSAAQELPARGWQQVVEEHESLFQAVLSPSRP